MSIAEGEIQEILIFGRKIAGLRVAPEKQSKLRNISAEKGEKHVKGFGGVVRREARVWGVNVARYGQIE